MKFQSPRHSERERERSQRRLYDNERGNPMLQRQKRDRKRLRSTGFLHAIALCRRAWFGMTLEKLVILLMLFLLTATFSSALAQSPRQVTVELKNGHFLRGTMAVSVQEDYLTLMREDQPLTHIPYRKIRSITFGKNPSHTSSRPREFLKQDRQFFHLGELHVLVGDGGYSPNTTVGIHTVNGYHFNPRLGVGLGVGMDNYGPLRTLPVYASVRGALLKRKVSPYYFANAGASPAWGRETDGFITDFKAKGGWMVHLGAGYQINLNRSALLLHAGFKSQQTRVSYQQNAWWGTDSFVEEKRTIRRVAIGIGFML